jgi:alkanesulfonate monooxygenase SsuD/methylene tetrahydromethanopterin reductase-like flavin-dependent oxidoreductase (luciferase family)
MRWIPTLSRGEIAAVEKHYREHKAEFDESDRQARTRREEQISRQRQQFPELSGTPEERRERLESLLQKRREKRQ